MSVSQGRTIKYLAVHYTAGVSCKAGSAQNTAAWFANPAADGSADYICDEAYLVQYNPDPMNRFCHAVGGDRYKTQGGKLFGVARNSNCISLEICSGNTSGKITYPNDPQYYFTDQVLETAKEAVQYLMQLYGIDADHVIRHYDVNGKPCPGVIGWNADSGSEERWEAFHAAIGGTPIQYYRVGTDWADGKCVGQIGAYTVLDNAKATADTCGYNVYDPEGVRIYTGTKPTSGGSTQAKTIHALANEKLKAAAMLELIHATDKSGILPSVTAAQMILESGYCGTDLALGANNCFGMKATLSGDSWTSVWDGKSTFTKRTAEQDKNGRQYYVTAAFRKYPCVEDSVKDHSLYLLGAMNGSSKRYAGLTDCKDYKAAIQLIKNGGYATDVKYVSKICDIIQRYGLDKYDGAIEPEPTPVTPTEPETPTSDIGYRVQVGVYKSNRYAAQRLRLAQEKIAADAWVLTDDEGMHIIVGSFDDREGAEALKKKIEDADICKASVEEYNK